MVVLRVGLTNTVLRHGRDHAMLTLDELAPRKKRAPLERPAVMYKGVDVAFNAGDMSSRSQAVLAAEHVMADVWRRYELAQALNEDSQGSRGEAQASWQARLAEDGIDLDGGAEAIDGRRAHA